MILVSSIQSIVTLTLVSTVSGSVTLHIIICKVPSYSTPLVGIIRVVVGVGTVCIETCDSMYFILRNNTQYLHMTLTVTLAGVEVMLSSVAGESSVPRHTYSPACDVCNEVNERVTMVILSSITVSVMVILSSPDVTRPVVVIH